MLERPDNDQTTVIRAPLERSLLVLAGPGSGKTRTLIGRISYLLHMQEAAAAITAVTFTNRAARHLQTRLEINLRGQFEIPQRVGTFHALAYHLLKEFPNTVDVPRSFAVSDERDKLILLRRAWEQVGMGAHPHTAALKELVNQFSLCKRLRHDPTECNGDHLGDGSRHFTEKQRQRLAVAYRQLLRDYQRVDFDDLILYAAQLLYDYPDIATEWYAAHPWLFVDEFQDIDEAQYQFLLLLAPPKIGRIMAVLDTEQSIYSWRGGDVKLVEKFRKDYKPQPYKLQTNYRSGTAITVACDHFLNRRSHIRTTAPNRSDTGICRRYWFDSPASEAQWMADEINTLLATGTKAGEIAILYRQHKLGEWLEPRLRDHKVNVQRIQREPFLERREAKEMLRYLEAAAKRSEDALAAALNFPRVVADEVTMAHLQRLAREKGLAFGDLLQQADAMQRIGHATRAQIRAFLNAVDSTLVPLVHAPMVEINEALFRLIEQRRSPYPDLESATLRGAVGFVERFLPWRDLRAALRSRPTVQVVAADSVDGWCAAAIVAGALRHFLLLEVVVTPLAAPVIPHALRLLCGANEPGAISFTEVDVGSLRYPAAFIAWQTLALTIHSFERFYSSNFVVMDLETTGKSPLQDRPVELAALHLRGFHAQGEGWHSLVNPLCKIDAGATKVHGIAARDVQDAPLLEAALPEYAAYLGERTLVGHNIRDFDVPMLATAMQAADLPPLINEVVDTLDLAKRLLLHDPDHKLESLVTRYNLSDGGAHHRAMNDVVHTQHLFKFLWEQHTQDQQLHSMVGALPFVAAAWHANGATEDEAQRFWEAGARVVRRKSDPDLYTLCRNSLSAEGLSMIAPAFAPLVKAPLPDTQDDVRWHELRSAWSAFSDEVMRLTDTPSLETFLSYASMMRGESDVTDNDHLTMMTIHAAKGKEFSAVFLVGVEATEMPSRHANTAEKQEEERRVAYVGMSRAADRLYLVGCANRADKRRGHSIYWRDFDGVVADG